MASDPGVLLLQLFTPEARANPYPIYAQLREAAPVIRSPMGGWMVTRYEQVDRVLRSSAFRTPRGYRDVNDPAGPPLFDPDGLLTLHRRNWVLFQSGEAHTRLRKLIMKVFTPRAVRALVPRIDALVDELLAPAIERGTMEVVAELAYPLPATVICELLGIPAADRERNRAWAAVVAATIDPMNTPAQRTAAEQAMAEWDPYIRALLADKRTRPGTSLLDDMLAVEDDGARLTEDEIAANATFLFLAGHETTTGLIGNGLYAMLKHPAQLSLLRERPAMLENAVEELLRFDSPVQFAPRVAIEPLEIEGVTIEKELPLMIALGCANHDPRRFERPDELDLARQDPKPLSFGGGPHYCVGAALARVETAAAFGKLIARAPTIELEAEPAWRAVLTLRGLQELRVRLA
ncbi:MAG: cytochrome P450 [Deltaproteobacteria bacterium]|nr:cytochrome P450 [Deltaproteobacteria bacterium]